MTMPSRHLRQIATMKDRLVKSDPKCNWGVAQFHAPIVFPDNLPVLRTSQGFSGRVASNEDLAKTAITVFLARL